MATESYGQLVTELRKLRLPAIAELLDSYTKQAVSSNMSYMDFLSGLVESVKKWVDGCDRSIGRT